MDTNQTKDQRQGRFVYIGNWDRHKAPPKNGFGICSYDAASGQLRHLGSALEEVTVGAACLHPTLDVLYCTDESSVLPGYYQGGGGQVYALSVEAMSGALREVNHSPSYGSLPSSLAVDRTGKFLIVTHHTDRVAVTKIRQNDSGGFEIYLEYDDAATVLFRLRENGAIGPPCDLYMHTGDGGPLPRQTHPQLHSINGAPSGSFFVVCDKGNDELVCLKIDEASAKLTLCHSPQKLQPGSSPRYTAFHPIEPLLFVNYETKAIVSSLRYDENGKLELLHTASALPEGCEDNFDMKQSDLVVHPSGRFLYSMIRGIHAVSVFSINERTGELKLLQTFTPVGEGPRGCAVSRDGRFLVVACWVSREVVLCAIGADGLLQSAQHALRQPNAGTVTFF